MFGGIISVLLASASALSPTKDALFTDWCHKVGIELPKAQLRTTNKSVAGRGVFATEDVQQGDVVMRIPEAAVLHSHNAELYFPQTAAFLANKRREIFQQHRRRHRRWDPRTIWRSVRPVSIEQDHLEFVNPTEDLWQMELTLFALDVLESADHHPWGPWVSEWYRDDPMHRLHEKNTRWNDAVEIQKCVSELHDMLPEASTLLLNAAVDLRLRRLDALKSLYNVRDIPPLDKMYGLLISRAIELGDGIAGVIPMFDMINHSDEPNVALSFDGPSFVLVAQCDVAENEEVRTKAGESCVVVRL
jgi:hypothetical protein